MRISDAASLLGKITVVRKYPIREAIEWKNADPVRRLSSWEHSSEYLEYLIWVRTNLTATAMVSYQMEQWVVMSDDYNDQTILALMYGDPI